MKQALEMALEALEKADKIRGFPNNKKAITAIKEALAQPEQEPFGHVTVRRLSQRFENHHDQFQFYPAGQSPYLDNVDECYALYTTPPQPEQEPVAWMGTDVEGNPNKFRLNFFSGAIPLFTTPEDRSLVSTNEKNGSPCSEFWDWLPKAYNFEGDGVFTKYNMEVAFLAGKQNVATNDTLSERVDEMQKQRHDTIPPQRTWVGLTDDEIYLATNQIDRNERGWAVKFARAIEAAHGIKE